MTDQTAENKMYGGDYLRCEICGRQSKETELRDARRVCKLPASCVATMGNLSFGGPAFKETPVVRFDLDEEDKASINNAVQRRLLQLAQPEVEQTDTELTENNCLALDHEGNQCELENGHRDDKGQVVHRIELGESAFRLWVDQEKSNAGE